MARDSWGSRIGFIFAVAGSAIGLGNIWRFPYVVGANGGAGFIFAYLVCLVLIGFPVLISEILIGRTAQTSPSGAFQILGKSKIWGWAGKLTILTGFLVSSFYSVVSGWILGYFFEAFKGNLTHFSTNEHAVSHYENLVVDPWWSVICHFNFVVIAAAVLYFGVRKGIERANKIMMPLLFLILLFLVIKGLTMPNSFEGVKFLLTPHWESLTPGALMLALGQSFFTLSVGQGTMVTYGSYLKKSENLLKSCVPIVIMDTCVALLAALAVFSIVFSVGLAPNSGPGLIFHTLPLVFSQISGGYLLALLFFLLVMLAALSSQISAMEPAIAYLMDDKKLNRPFSVALCSLGVFILGIPSALSFSVFKNHTFWGMNFLDFISFNATSILIPLGGLFAILLVAWAWGYKNAIKELKDSSQEDFKRFPWLAGYFWFCFKISGPILIFLVFFHALINGG